MSFWLCLVKEVWARVQLQYGLLKDWLRLATWFVVVCKTTVLTYSFLIYTTSFTFSSTGRGQSRTDKRAQAYALEIMNNTNQY